MIELYVDTVPDLWDLDWKCESYGNEELFDEHFVITGNRQFNEITEASWWKKATEVIDDLDREFCDDYKLDSYEDEFSKKIRKRIVDAYDQWNGRDKDELICDVLNILYPWKGYRCRGISGYSQGDWNTVYFAKEDEEYVDTIEAYYFGKLAEVHYVDTETEEDFYGTVTDDDLWRWEREGKLLEEIRDFFDLPKDEEYRLFKNDSYGHADWEEIFEKKEGG